MRPFQSFVADMDLQQRSTQHGYRRDHPRDETENGGIALAASQPMTPPQI